MRAKYILVLLACLPIILFTSCSKEPAHLTMIPDNSSMVFSVDLMSLAQKGELDKLEDTHFYKELQKEKKEQKFFDKMNELLTSPLIWGLDLTERVYVFYEMQADKRNYVGATLAVRKKGKFEELVRMMAKEADDSVIVKTVKNYRLAKFEGDNSVCIAWDDDKAVLLAATDKMDELNFEVERLMTLKKENSLLAKQTTFKTFCENSKDMDAWISMNIIRDLAYQNEVGKETTDKYLSYLDMLKDNAMEMHLAFETDSIVMDYQFHMTDKMKKEFDFELKDAKKSKLLAYMGDEDIFDMRWAVDMKQYYNWMEKMDNAKNFEPMGKEMKEAVGYDIKQLMTEILGGDFIISYAGAQVIEEPMLDPRLGMQQGYGMDGAEDSYADGGADTYGDNGYGNEENLYPSTSPLEFLRKLKPLATIAFTLKDDKAFQQILDKLLTDAPIQKKNGYYYYDLPTFSVHFGIHDHVFFLTTLPSVADGTMKGEYDGKKLSTLAESFKGSTTFYYLDMNYERYSMNEKLFESNRYMKRYNQILEASMEPFLALRMRGEGDLKYRASLTLRNSGKNSLSRLIRHFDKISNESLLQRSNTDI
ncbi:MAG: DUF4836 family protein [Chitinophagales bacterium]|nr:DUF4836 family protein [Chitinophagales bacterium]